MDEVYVSISSGVDISSTGNCSSDKVSPQNSHGGFPAIDGSATARMSQLCRVWQMQGWWYL